MAENSKIEWTTHTFNPWRGCTKVSAGCKMCYAETLSGRNPKTLGMWGPKGTRVVAVEAAWRQPLKWDKAAKAAGERHRVFCASLADVFEDWTGNMVAANGSNCYWCEQCKEKTAGLTPDRCTCGSPLRLATMQDVRARLFKLIDATPNLDWLLLTKRPENIAKMMPEYVRTSPSENWFFDAEDRKRRGLTDAGPHKSTLSVSGVGIVRPNLWIGTSVENQAAADERIPHLLKTPAAVRFLSVEPLLEEIELRYLPCDDCGTGLGAGSSHRIITDESSPLHPKNTHEPLDQDWCPTCTDAGTSRIHGIDWVIVGGESGPGARPMDIAWARSIVEQCKAAGVAVFVKQLGAKPLWQERDSQGEWQEELPRSLWRAPLLDRKGGDITEFPADLRVREFPA